MHIYPISKVKKVNLICKRLDTIINSHPFYDLLEELPGFDYSDDEDGIVDGKEVAQAFASCRWDARVRTYRPFWPWSKVNGYYDPSKGYEIISINSRRLWRSEKSIANTILHEVVHLVDFWDKTRTFGHGDNSPIGKSESAPWKVAQKVIDELY